MRARLAFLLPLFPIAMIAYACSSSSDNGDAQDGGSDAPSNPDGSTPDGGFNFDGSTEDGSVTDTGTDSPVVEACVGNPLSPDGGSNGIVLPAGALTTLFAAGTFIDGPQWIDARQSLVYSDVNANALGIIQGDGGNPSLFRDGVTVPIGNAVRNGVVVTVTAGDGTQSLVQTFTDGGPGPTIALTNVAAPNDLAVGKGGNLYITDPAYQQQPVATSVFRTNADAGGRLPIQTFNANNEHPNGVAFSPDGNTLYVTLTQEKQILKYTVGANGVVTGEPNATGTVVIQAAAFGAFNPDGMAVDGAGNLWVAAGNENGGSGKLMVFSPAGTFFGEIPIAGQTPTSVAFGGGDGKAVFVTTDQGILKYSSRCAGLK